MRDLIHSGFKAYSRQQIEQTLRAVTLATLLHPGDSYTDDYRRGFLTAIAAVSVAYDIPPQRIRAMLNEFGLHEDEQP